MQKPNPPFDRQDARNAENKGGVGVPVKGDSSGSSSPSDPDSPTLVEFPQVASDSEATQVDPEATSVDPDATIVEGMPPPLTSPPPPVRRPARQQVSTPLLTVGDVLGGR